MNLAQQKGDAQFYSYQSLFLLSQEYVYIKTRPFCSFILFFFSVGFCGTHSVESVSSPVQRSNICKFVYVWFSIPKRTWTNNFFSLSSLKIKCRISRTNCLRRLNEQLHVCDNVFLIRLIKIYVHHDEGSRDLLLMRGECMLIIRYY